MLKASREARRINHPYASYTSDGKLLCNLCETIIKTEAAWQGHLHSTQHTVRQTRAQDAAKSRGTETANGASKKRKAEDSDMDNENKKLKPTMIVSGGEDEADAEEVTVQVKGQGVQHVAESSAQDEQANPEELEAFERELAQMEASMPSRQANVTISAPAMTAEDIAAQAREEQSTQRERRAAELEAEKEDAAKVLEDEFEEMEGLEERVRKLREKREALRTTTSEGNGREETEGSKEERPSGTGVEEAEDDEDDDEDDEDLDDWNFGAR